MQVRREIRRDGSFETGRKEVRAVGQTGEGGSAEKGCTLKTNSCCTNPTAIQLYPALLMRC